MVANLNATVLPEVVKSSINETIVFRVLQSRQYAGLNTTETYEWELTNAQTGESLSPDIGSTLSTPFVSYTPTKRGVILAKVTYTVSSETISDVYTGSRTISISFPGQRFSVISGGDAQSSTPHNTENPPSGSQEPLSLQVLNLRASVAPCAHWKGPIRNYKVMPDGIYDPGSSTTIPKADRQFTRDWATKVGWEVLVTDLNNFSGDDLGVVKSMSSFDTGCQLSQAAPWHSPTDKPFLRCNGAKPQNKTDDAISEDESVGQCPFYKGKDWKYVFDDKLGFFETGTTPYITAQHIQELRLQSDDWSRYSNPMDEFRKRFPIDTDIWAWTGYLDSSASNLNDLSKAQKLKVRKVSVNSDVTEVLTSEERIIQPGSGTIGEVPDYPTLIKSLSDSTKIRIDFPLGTEETPFYIRSFLADKNFTELFGHIAGKVRQTVYAVNIDYVIKQTIDRGFGAIRPVDEASGPANPYVGILTHSEYIQFLLSFAPDLIFETTTNDSGVFGFGMDWDTDSNDWILNKETRIPLLYEWEGVTEENPVAVKNRIKVFMPSQNSSGEMYTDKTYICYRMLHAFTYQTNFLGNCDNTDSTFQNFQASVEVQLATGYESIDRFIIASPDLASNYASWRSSRIEGAVPKRESYWLEKLEESEIILTENIFPLYSGEEFFVKLNSLNANRVSRWQVTKAQIIKENQEEGLDLDVVLHSNEEGDVWLSDSLGSSYPNGDPMPANYLHLRIPSGSASDGFTLKSSEVQIQITFSYLVHNQNVLELGLSPTDPNRVINVLPNPIYQFSYSSSDGLNYYSEDREIPPLATTRLVRSYTITGSAITDKIRYIVFITDDEGRPIGKKESAVLFAVGVPSCGDHFIRYSWTPMYEGATLGPRGLRFCDWGSCNPEWGYSCSGTPIHIPSGIRQGAFSVTGNCFDHGLMMDLVWWPFNNCFAARYKKPDYFSVITEYVPTGVRSSKYLAGYPYFFEGVDNTGFWDCTQGTYYKNFRPISPEGFGSWSGYQGIRAGDLRSNQTYDVGFFGTKNGSQWFWGADRERLVFYVGTERAMNFVDLGTGYATTGSGVDGVTGQGYLTEPAGVDLNPVATEDYIHPFNILMGETMCGFPVEEELAVGSYVVAASEEMTETIDYRQSARYYITPSQSSEEGWTWPLISWSYKNNLAIIMDTNGNSTAYYRSEFPEENKQAAWVFRDKRTLPIGRDLSQSVAALYSKDNLSLNAIVLSYPPDHETFSSVPMSFEDLEPQKSLIYSYRLDDGEHNLSFKAPSYGTDGTIQPGFFAKLSVSDIGDTLTQGPERSILPTGYFIAKDGSSGPQIPHGTLTPEEPYSTGMKVFDDTLIDKCLTSDWEDLHIETRKPPTSPTSSDNLMRRICLVKQPITYHSLPYKVSLVAGPGAATEVAAIKTMYKYSRLPNFGEDSNLPAQAVRYPANVTGGILDDSASLTCAYINYGGETLEVRLVTGVHNPSEGKFLKETFLDSIDLSFRHGQATFRRDNSDTVDLYGDIPSVTLEVKGISDSSYTTVTTISGTKALTGGGSQDKKVSFENIDFPVDRVRFTFNKPKDAPSTGTSLLINNISIYGRVLVDKQEIIQCHDLKYTISKMNKEDGVQGLNGRIDNVIPGLIHEASDEDEMESVMAFDTYVGDARREIKGSTLMILRPIIPQPQGNADSGNSNSFVGKPDGAYASVFKGGRVAMGQRRGDLEFVSTNLLGQDYCSGTVPIEKANWGQGAKGPLECAQEGAYKYAANFFKEAKAVYKVWMHPDEVSFFTSIGIRQEFLPTFEGGTEIKCTLESSIPKELFQFRGDDSSNYVDEAGGYFAQGHFASQLPGGECWCWVGKITPICGKVSAPCIDRYIVHEHNGNMSYTNDFGAVLRRYYTLVNRAFILMSVATTADSNELFGQAFQSTDGVDPLQFWNTFPSPMTNATVSNTNVYEMGSGFIVWWPGGFSQQTSF